MTPSGPTLLQGTEVRSVEITGRLDPGRARELAGPGLAVREDAEGAEIEMLAFRMKGLAPRGLPWLGADYGEVLFRLGVETRSGPAWLAVRCFLDSAPVASLAAALIKYPVTRVTRVDLESDVDGWRLAVADRTGCVLSATLVPDVTATPPPAPVRPVLVRAQTSSGLRAAPDIRSRGPGALLRVPWEETPAPLRWRARALVGAATLELGALGAHARWISAIVHEGRTHRCGIAGRERTDPRPDE